VTVTRHVRTDQVRATTDAQLSDGGGSVTCQITVNGQVVSTGTAPGADEICSAEISQDPFTGNWQDDNSG
jgi:hypothetical protein